MPVVQRAESRPKDGDTPDGPADGKLQRWSRWSKEDGQDGISKMVRWNIDYMRSYTVG
jgi:hypothetical protein